MSTMTLAAMAVLSCETQAPQDGKSLKVHFELTNRSKSAMVVFTRDTARMEGAVLDAAPFVDSTVDRLTPETYRFVVVKPGSSAKGHFAAPSATQAERCGVAVAEAKLVDGAEGDRKALSDAEIGALHRVEGPLRRA